METNLVGLSGPIMISIDVTYRCNFRWALLYDICNSIYYVINYLYQVSDLIPPSFFVVVGKPTSILNEGGFFFYS